jgi:hypothetical protein
MHVPEAMRSLAAGFHQDIFVVAPTLQGAVDHALSFLSKKEKTEARSFLLELLGGATSVSEIRKIWDGLPKDIRIDDDDQVVEFLKYILLSLSRAE